MFKAIIPVVAICSLALLPALTTGAQRGEKTLTFESEMTGAIGSASAVYREMKGTNWLRQDLLVTVSGGEPEFVYKVRIDGMKVGTFTTDENGNGVGKFKAPPGRLPIVRPGSDIILGDQFSGEFN